MRDSRSAALFFCRAATLSGSKLERPELHRLFRDASAGDIILLEQIDWLSRLTSAGSFHDRRADARDPEDAASQCVGVSG
jgi:hypothetical protein